MSVMQSVRGWVNRYFFGQPSTNSPCKCGDYQPRANAVTIQNCVFVALDAFLGRVVVHFDDISQSNVLGGENSL